MKGSPVYTRPEADGHMSLSDSTDHHSQVLLEFGIGKSLTTHSRFD